MRFAIIDIGYNAIRAVVYENDSIGAPEIFNNKFKNDILTLLTHESLDIKHQAYLSIQHLLQVFKSLNVSKISCVATAVLRGHPRAQDLIKYIQNTYKLDINIISGDEEARLTALGLVSAIKNSNGIAADLGGGSLELIQIANGQIGHLTSLKLGTKTVDLSNASSTEDIAKIISEQYREITSCKNLYFIGGSLRFISRLYINHINFPIKNLHNTTIDTEDFYEYLCQLQSDVFNNHKRINYNAILIAKAMIVAFHPQKIVVSTYGLKEGVRISNMSDAERNKDIIIEKIKYLSNASISGAQYHLYAKIINRLIEHTEDIEYIVQLAIMLLPIKRQFDVTLNATAITEYILSSEIPFSARIRVMLALILTYTTYYKPGSELLRISKKLLTIREYSNCQIIGTFLSIAEEIDGPHFIEPSFDISVHNNYLAVDTGNILPRQTFDKVCGFLKSIAFYRKINLNHKILAEAQ